MSYPGLRNNGTRRRKYADCERSKRRGITVRPLSPAEINKFQSHIDRLIAGQGQKLRQWCSLI